MKKTIGYLLIICCGFLLLSFTIGTAIIIFRFGEETTISSRDAIMALLGVLFLISLLILGFRKGLKNIRKEKPIAIIAYDKEIKLHLKGIIPYKEYRNAILGLSLKRKFAVVYLIAVTLLILINQSNSDSILPKYTIPTLIAASIAIPLALLYNIKKQYQKSRLFHEEIHYYINNESIQLKSETIDANLKWVHYHKVKESKHFFLFYQSHTAVTVIDKGMFAEEELQDFKKFIQSLAIKKEA